MAINIFCRPLGKTTNVATEEITKFWHVTSPYTFIFTFFLELFSNFGHTQSFKKKVLMQSFAVFASAPSTAARCLSNVMSLVVAMIRT